MNLHHFYGCPLGHGWGNPAREHIAALEAAGLDCPVTVGLTGTLPQRDWAVDWWRRRLPGAELVGADALTVLWYWAQHNRDAAVLFCHTLAGDGPRSGHFGAAWRRSMTSHVVGGWKRCLELLETADAVGCHWLDTPGEPGWFAGGFWWARADYLASLPEPSGDPEQWIGLGRPIVHDLNPGVPSPAMFAKDILEAMNPSLRGEA